MFDVINKQVTTFIITIILLIPAIILSYSSVLSSLKLPIVYFQINQTLPFTS
jgi:hypothetical protein